MTLMVNWYWSYSMGYSWVPSHINSHPHQSNNGRFTLVHNGVIENYEELKANTYQM